MITVGSRVVITAPADSYLVTGHIINGVAHPIIWWPKGLVTGTIQKLFKNGSGQVAIDQIKNRSEDGRKTMILPLTWMKEA